MYNRYIPQPDGSYRRRSMAEPERPAPPPPPPPPEPPGEPPPREEVCPEPRCPRQERRPPPMPAGSFLKQLLPKDLDTGDLIVILLLLLMAGDCREDKNTALLTLALYLFL